MRPINAPQRGFTLVEAVMVMVITGILGGMVTVFIGGPMRSYIDSANRGEMADSADLALRRMAREIRLALPNSIRVTSAGARTSIEFLLMKTGGRYWAVDDPVAGDFLRFPLDPADAADVAAAAADVSFDVVGAMPDGRQQIVAGDSIVVYNLGPGMAPADAYNCSGACNRAVISAVAGNKVTLASNPFAAQNPVMASPGNRFQVLSTPVSYDCNGAAGGAGQLIRHSNYPISAAQNLPPTGTGLRSSVLANNVVSCVFQYGNLTTTRSGLVGLTLTLQVPGSADGALTLSQQVHVDNTP